MIGREGMKKITDDVLASSTSDETQVSVYAWDSWLTRFANSYIHQNMGESNISVEIKCITGKKVGAASTNKIDSNSLKETTKRAEEIMRLQRENPDFVSLPEPGKYKEVSSFFKETRDFGDMERARACKRIIEEAQDFNAYGSFSNGVLEVCIANSHSLFAYNLSSGATLISLIIGPSGSGYGCAGSRNVNDIDYETLARKTKKKAKLAQNPIDIEPGEYTVVLEDLAVADIIQFLAYLGFGANPYQEGRSFMSGKIGKKIIGENITIWDDGLDPRGMPFSFDFEGVPKQRVSLIEKGIAKGVVYDTTTAHKEGKKSTGHCTGSSVFGPYPMHLFMQGGDSKIEKMIKETKKGIYVTRFHYTNPVEPMRAVITGMTRDGTFLIENGEVTRPLKNLRFTMSLISALSKVTHLSPSKLVISQEQYGVPFLTGTWVPALRIEGWKFTGVTEY